MLFQIDTSKLWGLAAGGPLALLHKESFRKLETRYRAEVCLKILADWWNVSNRSAAFKTLDWLMHRGYSIEAVALVNGAPAEAYPGRVAVATQNEAEIRRAALRAWDLGRIVSVARWCHGAGFLSADEAWGWILSIGPVLQEYYDSWEAYGNAWSLGYRYWDEYNRIEANFLRDLQWLMTNPRSPWKQIRWSYQLRRVEPPFPNSQGGGAGEVT